MRKLLIISCLVLAGLVPAKADYIDSSGINHLTSKKNDWPQSYIGAWCGSSLDSFSTFNKPDEKGNCDGKEGRLTIEKDNLTFDQLTTSFELTRVSCQFNSVKPRFDRKAPNSTHTEGNIVVRIKIGCEDVDDMVQKLTLDLVIYKGRDLWVYIKNPTPDHGR